MILPALSLSVSALPSGREESVLSLLPLKLLCSAAKLYQQGILLFTSLLPPPTLFSSIFVVFGSAKGAEAPLDCGTSRGAAEKQMLQLKGAAGGKAPSEALSEPQAFCQRFPSVPLPVLGINPCYTGPAACT